MIDSYVEQCKQAGRELAIKEASLLTPLALSTATAATGATSRSPILRFLNRSIGTTAGGLMGAKAGFSMIPTESIIRAARPNEALLRGLGELNPMEALGILGAIGAPAALGGYAANRLVRGGEKFNRAISRAARAPSSTPNRISPVDLVI